MEKTSDFILQTISYSDIFDYPLTGNEIQRWIVRPARRIGGERAKSALKELLAKGEVAEKDGYFFLAGREKIVELRLRKEECSKKKIKIAQKTAQKLRIIPLIKMIAVTGALSMSNCRENDDIDLMIITAQNTLWLTRILIWLICPICQIRRRKVNDINVKDKICFNLYLDEAGLEIKEKNLFTAHEICQVKPLYNKDKTYEKFLLANFWVKKYLPNAVSFNNLTIKQFNNCSGIAKLLNCLTVVLNKAAFRMQSLYMKPKITIEKVSLHQAFFHPKKPSKKVEEFVRIKLP